MSQDQIDPLAEMLFSGLILQGVAPEVIEAMRTLRIQRDEARESVKQIEAKAHSLKLEENRTQGLIARINEQSIEIAGLKKDRTKLIKACEDALSIASGLSDQQAMQDDWWVDEYTEIADLLKGYK